MTTINNLIQYLQTFPLDAKINVFKTNTGYYHIFINDGTVKDNANGNIVNIRLCIGNNCQSGLPI